MQSRTNGLLFNTHFNFGVDSVFVCRKENLPLVPPVTPGFFMFLDGTPFFLLDGTNLLLL